MRKRGAVDGGNYPSFMRTSILTMPQSLYHSLDPLAHLLRLNAFAAVVAVQLHKSYMKAQPQ